MPIHYYFIRDADLLCNSTKFSFNIGLVRMEIQYSNNMKYPPRYQSMH